jgi:preprotein translocase subunit SecG
MNGKASGKSRSVFFSSGVGKKKIFFIAFVCFCVSLFLSLSSKEKSDLFEKKRERERDSLSEERSFSGEKKSLGIARGNHLPELSSCFQGPPPSFTSNGPARERHSESAGESGVGVSKPSTMALPSASSISSRFLVPDELIFA